MVPSESFFCITIWLPRLRTSSKPDSFKIAQTSLPERTRNLANSYLDLRDEDLLAKPLLDLIG